MSASDSGPLAHVTADDVLRWGRAQPAEAVIGECEAAGRCLLAEYAMDVLDVYAWIFPNRYASWAYYTVDGHDYVLPDDLNTLAARFDGLVIGQGEDARLEMHPADLDRLEVTL